MYLIKKKWLKSHCFDFESRTESRILLEIESLENIEIQFSHWRNSLQKKALHVIIGFPDAARKDALTKKPLDLEEEDEARKFETSKWLESHFGSDSRSSHGSLDADDSPLPTSTNTSYINVTMKSCTPKERDYQNVSSSRHQRRSGRDSDSPSRYFHGISEWSERYQGRGMEKIIKNYSQY